MKISIARLTPSTHRVLVERADGSTEDLELDSRSFLRHDLAHFAVESAVGIRGGYWGSVAAGASLRGIGLAGDDVSLAESLAGPVQTLMRLDAPVDAYVDAIRRVAPDVAARRPEVAEQLHELVRRLRGHLAGTPFGSPVELTWDVPLLE